MLHPVPDVTGAFVLFLEEELDDLHSLGSENRNGSTNISLAIGKLMEFMS